MNPLVSIIVPVYNTETFVLRTLKSVSTQDYNNLEVIIIDDKSTDHSIQVIDNFIKQN
jgi:glycosyltransferase involved in cell wall biosynthesis